MKLPRALIGEIGVLKKITDDTMTTTRLTEFATEWVTGDILANKLYETCLGNKQKLCYRQSRTKLNRTHGKYQREKKKQISGRS